MDRPLCLPSRHREQSVLAQTLGPEHRFIYLLDELRLAQVTGILEIEYTHADRQGYVISFRLKTMLPDVLQYPFGGGLGGVKGGLRQNDHEFVAAVAADDIYLP